MKFSNQVFLVTALSVLALSLNSFGQNNCPQTLKKAQATYDEGRISEVEDLLEPCLKVGFNKEEKIAAYKLLTLTYLYFNERTKAEGSMHEFLKLNPEYKINETLDPTEFINLYNSFRTTPVLIYGLKIGLNVQDIHVTNNFSVDNSAVSRGDYASPLGFQVGLSFEIPIKKKVSFITELYLSKKGYKYSDEILGFAKINFQENQTLLEVPLLLNINFGKKKFKPFINFGGTVNFLLGSNATVSRQDFVETGVQRVVAERTISINELRHKLIYYATIGAGFKIKNVIGNGYLIAELRYNLCLRNIVNPANRTSNPDLLFDYLYIDNNFNMNSLTFSVGYALPKYKPKIKPIKAKKEKQETNN